jgi:hypothetical protein
VLVFHGHTPEVRRHEALEIVKVDAQQLVARTQSGQEHVVTAHEAQAFDVYERRPIEIAPHDRLLLTANRQEPGLRVTNGEMVTVSQVDERGRVHLEDGRMIPSAYKHFDYGYAVTAHRSQGQSMDAVLIASETMSRGLFYVAASRGREHVTVITSDKARLEESVGRFSQRSLRRCTGRRPPTRIAGGRISAHSSWSRSTWAPATFVATVGRPQVQAGEVLSGMSVPRSICPPKRENTPDETEEKARNAVLNRPSRSPK